ncbi:MAG TPA: prolipoprotein diacylglyceryl transferase family protein [Opitutaceae bacterium]|nr:prolipoprotein diacylglyceryl transferase family protein [Opitutaceae bacterium]
MTFPVHLDFLGWRVHPHVAFEALGYFAGARIYFSLRRRDRETPLPLETNLWLLVGCIFGAWAGSKLLAWAEMPAHYLAVARANPLGLLGGKTIAGGLLGGWAGVEVAKKICGVARSTGDTFVWPLAVGTALGRLGCFFTGLDDHTYGVATSLPWSVDFGDGVPRHPTQLYEAIFVLLLASAIAVGGARRAWPVGARFRLYVAGYFAFRFGVEFLKPRETPVAGLSAIQLASLAGVILALNSLRRLAPQSAIANPQS